MEAELEKDLVELEEWLDAADGYRDDPSTAADTVNEALSRVRNLIAKHTAEKPTKTMAERAIQKFDAIGQPVEHRGANEILEEIGGPLAEIFRPIFDHEVKDPARPKNQQGLCRAKMSDNSFVVYRPDGIHYAAAPCGWCEVGKCDCGEVEG
jgi:hypothetical protein